MYDKYYILGLCLFVLGSSLAAKYEKSDRQNEPGQDDFTDWQRSNTMSREKGEPHAKPSDMINIDDNPKGVYYGSGDQQHDDDEDYSGDGWDDDEDSSEGSGGGHTPEKSACLSLRREFNNRELLGAYIPRCTETGEFERMQCHSSTGECWCVDINGREISGSKQSLGRRPNCDGYMPPKDRNPSKGGDMDFKPNPTDDIKNSIDNMGGGNPSVEIETVPPGSNQVERLEAKGATVHSSPTIFGHPGILAGIIGGAVVGLLCAVLLVMFIVYRMRKKDEGSYALDEPKRSPTHNYQRAPVKEFYA